MPRTLIALMLLLLLAACGGDEQVNRTNRNKAEADARASLGVIREAMVRYFKKHSKIPEEPNVLTFGIEPGQLRRTWYDDYTFEMGGDEENAYKGTKVIAKPKEEGVAPVVTMEFESVKTGAHTIRVE